MGRLERAQASYESGAFQGAELDRVTALVGEHQALLLEAWREDFGK